MPNGKNHIGILNRLRSRDIAVHQHRCVRVRNRNASCRKCADACTSGCISFAENELVIDAGLCVGCGTCCTVCPTCALEALRPNDAELFDQALAAMRAANGEVVLADEQALSAVEGLYDPERVVSVISLGRVEETLLIRLAHAGARRITLVHPREIDEAAAKGIQAAEMVCASANAILEAWNSPCRARVHDKFPKVARRQDKAEYDEARRRFFTGLVGNARDTARVVTGTDVGADKGAEEEQKTIYEHLHVMEDGTIPHFIPDRRERLLNTLYDMGEPIDVTLETRLWGYVLIDTDKCTGCRACATFCPTGAIFKFTDQETGKTGVEHAPADCVKCCCCQDVCPVAAITVADEVAARNLLSGAVVTYEMEPEVSHFSNRYSIVNSMKRLLGTDRIFE